MGDAHLGASVDVDQLGVHRRFGSAGFWTIGHVQLKVSSPSIPCAPARCKSSSCTWPIVQAPHRRRTLLRMRRAWQRKRGVRVECTCRIGSTNPIEMLPKARSSSTACPAPHHTRSAPAPAAACCVAGSTTTHTQRETDGQGRAKGCKTSDGCFLRPVYCSPVFLPSLLPNYPQVSPAISIA